MSPRRLAIGALGAILLTGCGTTAAGPGAHAGESYIVNTQRTLFYSFGPAQVNGPDLALYHGQRLTMLSRAYGFSHVTIPDTGQTGYVSTDDLIPAPPAPRPSPTPASAVHRHRSSRASRPPTAEEQGRIPLPEFPESKPPPGAPSFRY